MILLDPYRRESNGDDHAIPLFINKWEATATPQIIRPVSDSANSGWVSTEGDIFSAITSPDDSKYITSGVGTSDCTLDLGTSFDPRLNTGWKLHIKMVAVTGMVTVKLYADLGENQFSTDNYTLSVGDNVITLAEVVSIQDFTTFQLRLFTEATGNIIDEVYLELPLAFVTIPNVEAPPTNGFTAVFVAFDAPTGFSGVATGSVDGLLPELIAGSDLRQDYDGGRYVLYGWYIHATDTQDITVVFSGAATSLAAVAVTYNHVNQATPFGTGASATDDATNGEVLSAPSGGDVAISACLYASGSDGVYVNQFGDILRFDTLRDPNISLAGSEHPDVSLMGWSANTTPVYMILFAIGLNRP